MPSDRRRNLTPDEAYELGWKRAFTALRPPPLTKECRDAYNRGVEDRQSRVDLCNYCEGPATHTQPVGGIGYEPVCDECGVKV